MDDQVNEERKAARYGLWLLVFLLGVALGGIACMALDPPNIFYDDAAGASDPRPG